MANHFNLQEEPTFRFKSQAIDTMGPPCFSPTLVAIGWIEEEWNSNLLMNRAITVVKALSQIQWGRLHKLCCSDSIYFEPNPQIEINTEPESCKSFDIATQRKPRCSLDHYDQTKDPIVVQISW